MHKIFMRKENRNRYWKSLSKEERKRLRRTSARNQLLHPMYVEDWPRQLSKAEKGLGNTLYKTYFAVLYIVEDKLF